MDEDATWYGSRHRRRPYCIRRFPALRERGTAPPLLGPCLLWPRSPISATTELLYNVNALCPVHTDDADATKMVSLVASAVWTGHIRGDLRMRLHGRQTALVLTCRPLCLPVLTNVGHVTRYDGWQVCICGAAATIHSFVRHSTTTVDVWSWCLWWRSIACLNSSVIPTASSSSCSTLLDAARLCSHRHGLF